MSEALWTIFPLFGITESGACTCSLGNDCKRVGKHPIADWKSFAPGQVERGPAGHGVRTGREFRFFVVDADDKSAESGPNGLANLDALEARHGDLPETYTVETPRPGVHLYFRYPEGRYVPSSVGVIAPGIDIRSDGAIVVAQGSPHKNGGRYERSDADDNSPIVLADAPTWLLDMIDAASRTPDVATAPVKAIDVATPDGQARIALARKYLEGAPPAVEGSDGSGRTMGVATKLTRHFALPEDTALALMQDLYNPRCDPPWSHEELARKVHEAATKGRMPEGDILTEAQRANLQAAVASLSAVRAVPPPSARRRPRKGHRYTFTPGDISGGKKAKIGLSDAINMLVTDEAWEGVLQYDAFSRKVFAVDPPMRLHAEKGDAEDVDITAILAWFETAKDALLSAETIKRVVKAAAERHAYHPVKEYLEALPPVGAGPRLLDNLASVLYGDDTPIAQVFVRKWLVAAVRRILWPGCKVDTMLVLHGAQGARKSTVCRTLFGKWFRDELPDLDKKDAALALQGHWGVEFAELDKLLRANERTVKSFLSREEDRVRPPYGIGEITSARSCVFIGTTNELDFLRDPTGGRRYWPICVSRSADIVWLRAHRDRIWREAYEMALLPHDITDPPANWHWLTDEEEQAADIVRLGYEQRHIWEDVVRDYCAGREYVTASAVYLEAIAHSDPNALAKSGTKETRLVGEILRWLGCKAGSMWLKTEGGRGRSQSVFQIPDEIRNGKPSPSELRRRASADTLAKLAFPRPS